MFSMAAYQNVDDICEAFKLDRDQIAFVRLLGSGNFGQVSKAIYGASQSVVAVKSLKGNWMFLFYFFLLYAFVIFNKLNLSKW